MPETVYREVLRVESEDRTDRGIASAERRFRSLSALFKPLTITANVIDRATAPLRSIASHIGRVMSLAAGFAIGAGLAALPGFLIESAKAAGEDAASLAKLQQAVKNSGASWEQYGGQLQRAIDHGMQLGFSDDAQRDSLALLVAQTGSVTEAQKRMGFAMDLSRGAGLDLTTASRLLGKVTDENVNVLSRYGITVRKGATETELFAAIQQKFGGQADAFAESTAGAAEALSLQWGELKEDIGTLVLPAFTRLLRFMNRSLVPFLRNRLVPGIAALEAGLTRKLAPAITVSRALFTAFTKDAGAMGIVVDQVRRVFGDAAGDALDPFAGALMRMIPTLRGVWGQLAAVVGGRVSWREAAGRALDGLRTALEGAFGGLDLGAAASGLADRLGQALAAADWKGAGQSVADGLGSAMEKANPTGLQSAAESHAAAYVHAFGAWVAKQPPVSLPGLDQTFSLHDFGVDIEGASGPLGKFLATFGGVLPLLLLASNLTPLVAGAIGGLAVSSGAAVATLGTLGLTLGAVLLPLALIAAAVAALYVIWSNDLFGIQEIAAQVFGAVSAWLSVAIPAGIAWLQANVPPALEALRGALASVWGVLQQFLPDWGRIAPYAQQAGAAIVQMAQAAWPPLQAAIEAAGPLIQQTGALLSEMGKTILPILGQAAMMLAPIIKEGLTGTFQGLFLVIGGVAQLLGERLPATFAKLKLAFDQMTAVLKVATDNWQAFVDTLSAVANAYNSLRSSLPTIPTVPILGTPPVGEPKAEGGPVFPGHAYLVGEEGPEPFMPWTAGTILPNDALGGGMSFGGDIHLHFAELPRSRGEARRVAVEVFEEMLALAGKRQGNVVAGAL